MTTQSVSFLHLILVISCGGQILKKGMPRYKTSTNFLQQKKLNKIDQRHLNLNEYNNDLAKYFLKDNFLSITVT